MPWTTRAEQLQLMNTEYIAVPEDNMIFHERDEEGNPLPPDGGGEDTLNGGSGNDTTGGGLSREDDTEQGQHPLVEHALQERGYERQNDENHPVYEEDQDGTLRRQEEDNRPGGTA